MFFQMDSKIISAEQEKPLQALTSLTKKSFHLLWRGSRDGFDGKVFHSLCDGKPNTLTVIKSENGCIFGGYTSEPWSSDEGFITDSSAFLYSLTNPSNTPFRMQVRHPTQAVYHYFRKGPTFGRNELVIFDRSADNCSMHFYARISDTFICPNGINSKFITGSEYKFQMVEIEVFQVV